MKTSPSLTFRDRINSLNRQIALTADPKTKAMLEGRRAGLLNDRMMELQSGKVSRRLAEALTERSAA